MSPGIVVYLRWFLVRDCRLHMEINHEKKNRASNEEIRNELSSRHSEFESASALKQSENSIELMLWRP